MNLDSGGLPTRRDGVGVVDEQIGARMAVFIEVVTAPRWISTSSATATRSRRRRTPAL
jgi:hypothetical protein